MTTFKENPELRELSPYFQLHAEDKVDWHHWDETTKEKARTQGQDLRLLIGHYTHSFALAWERRLFSYDEYVGPFADAFINVLVDRFLNPEIEHLYLSAIRGLVDPAVSREMHRRLHNQPSVLILESSTLAVKSVEIESYLDAEVAGVQGMLNHKGVVSESPRLWEVVMTKAGAKGRPTRPVSGRGSSALPSNAIAFPTGAPNLRNSVKDESATKAENAPITLGDLLRELSSSRRPWADVCADYYASLSRMASPTDPTGANFNEDVLAHCSAGSWLLKFSHMKLQEKSPNVARDAEELAAGVFTRHARSAWVEQLSGAFAGTRSLETRSMPDAEDLWILQAQLVSAYADVIWQSRDPFLEQVARRASKYLLDHVGSLGLFGVGRGVCSDIEVPEFSFDKRKVKASLDEEEWLVFETLYGLDRAPNFQNRYLLQRMDSFRSVAERLFMSEDQAAQLLASSHAKIREQVGELNYVIDARVLAPINAVIGRALLKLGMVTKDEQLLAAGTRIAFAFVSGSLSQGFEPVADEASARTADRYRNVVYALDLLLMQLQVEWHQEVFETVKQLVTQLVAESRIEGANVMVPDYLNPEKVGLPVYQPLVDYSLNFPPAVLVACRVLAQYSRLTGESRWSLLASRQHEQIQMFNEKIGQILSMLEVDLQMDSACIKFGVVLRGGTHSVDQWRSRLQEKYHPHYGVYSVPRDAGAETLNYLTGNASDTGKAEAYLVDGDGSVRRFESLAELVRVLS